MVPLETVHVRRPGAQWGTLDPRSLRSASCRSVMTPPLCSRLSSMAHAYYKRGWSSRASAGAHRTLSKESLGAGCGGRGDEGQEWGGKSLFFAMGERPKAPSGAGGRVALTPAFWANPFSAGQPRRSRAGLTPPSDEAWEIGEVVRLVSGPGSGSTRAGRHWWGGLNPEGGEQTGHPGVLSFRPLGVRRVQTWS